MFEPKTKMINGMEFKVVPFPAIEALRLKADLLKLIGPSLGMMLGSFESMKSVMDIKIDGIKISQSIQTLFDGMSTDTFMAFVRRMLKSTSTTITVKDKPVFMNFQDEANYEMNFNMVFEGKIFTIYPVMLFVLEVNYPDFFAKAGAIGSRLTTSMSQPDKGSETNASEKLVTSEN